MMDSNFNPNLSGNDKSSLKISEYNLCVRFLIKIVLDSLQLDEIGLYGAFKVFCFATSAIVVYPR